jgi:hypothetical protein
MASARRRAAGNAVKRWLVPSAVGVVLLLLIPIVVVFSPPVRATWDPDRRAADAERRAAEDAPGNAGGRARADAGAPAEFFGTLATRTALEEAVRHVPPRTDGVDRQWSYAIAGEAWTGRSPLEMTASDVRRCEDGAGSASCIASLAPAAVHGRVLRVRDGTADVAVTWAAGRLRGDLMIQLARDGGAWRVRAVGTPDAVADGRAREQPLSRPAP